MLNVIVLMANLETIQAVATPALPRPQRRTKLMQVLNAFRIALIILPPFVFSVSLFLDQKNICASKSTSQIAIAVITGFISHGLGQFLDSLVNPQLIQDDAIRDWTKSIVGVIWGYFVGFFFVQVFTLVYKTSGE
jgi:uncharacterized membrane protein